MCKQLGILLADFEALAMAAMQGISDHLWL
ncbi:hypothetical protein DFAR_3200014 [Desulfarculales bacterium]